MLIRRSERAARRGAFTADASSERGLDRRTFLRRSGLAGGLATLGALSLGAVRKAEAGPPPPAGAQVTIRKSVCTHCAVGCTVLAEVANDVWIGQEPAWDSPDQSRLALRQGRGGARTGERRTSAQISDEARQRAVDAGHLGPGDRRDRRQDSRHPLEVGAGFGLLAWLGQDDQRRLLSVPQVRRVLGHQQYRSPGAHLPFDHRHRRGQYLGLRRDDQQLQRHPQFQDDPHLGRQSRRSASGLVAAYSRRRRA